MHLSTPHIYSAIRSFRYFYATFNHAFLRIFIHPSPLKSMPTFSSSLSTAPLTYPPALLFAAHAISLILLIRTLYRLPYRILARNPVTLHIFFIISLLLTLLALMRIQSTPALTLHLSGITATTLIMGKRLAFLAGFLSQLLLLVLARQTLAMLGLTLLLEVALPIAMSYAFHRILERKLPKNPFIFALGAGFFGAILSISATMLISAGIVWTIAVHDFTTIWSKYLMFMPIIIYPEGFLNGLITTAMVAFYPKHLSCFNPDWYLK